MPDNKASGFATTLSQSAPCRHARSALDTRNRLQALRHRSRQARNQKTSWGLAQCQPVHASTSSARTGEMPSQAQGEMPSQRRRVARQLRRAAAQSSLPFALSLSKGGKVALSVATIGHCGTSRSASRNEHQGSLFTQRMASTNSPPANRDAALAPTPVAFYPTLAAMPDRWP
jgi:hypothetical protein